MESTLIDSLIMLESLDEGKFQKYLTEALSKLAEEIQSKVMAGLLTSEKIFKLIQLFKSHPAEMMRQKLNAGLNYLVSEHRIQEVDALLPILQ